MVDRLTDRAHIIETGTESYRLRRTLALGNRPNPAIYESAGTVNEQLFVDFALTRTH